MVKNYANTIRIDTAFFFENEGKNLRFQKYPDRADRALVTHTKKFQSTSLQKKDLHGFPKLRVLLKCLHFTEQ